MAPSHGGRRICRTKLQQPSAHRWGLPSHGPSRSRRLRAWKLHAKGDRLRAALIDSLTHELRTPLTSIRAAATTLTQDEGLDDEARKELATIVDEESAHLDALIGEAVEMAELDANVLKVQPEPSIRAWCSTMRLKSRTRSGTTPGHPDGAGTRPTGMVRCQTSGPGVSPLDRKCRAIFAAGKPHRVAQSPRRRSTGI